MKFSVTLAFLFVTFLAATVNCQRHNATWGRRHCNDFKIHYGFVRKPAAFLRKVSTDYYFNQTLEYHRRNITQIMVTDLYSNGKGGYASLVSGGPRSNNATIHFKSQRSYGLAFRIVIYGH